MAMTEEHKTALAQGRREAKAIKGYLEAIAVPKRRGRPITPETLEAKIVALDEKIRSERDPLSRLDLYQARIDARAALETMTATIDLDALEAEFVAYAASYSNRKGISWTAWREAGVPASVLATAGVKRTRTG
ncbi:MAG: hypothetical protein U9N79_00160 [Actinomycetota bacterium]|nr:hypothetical protein [Actinomycetota bacterium]